VPLELARVAALVFDNDGTLVDSAGANLAAWQAAAAAQDVAFEADWYATRTGLSGELLLDDLGALAGRELPRATMVAAHAEAYAGALGALRERPDVAAIARSAHGRWPLAVCSGARRAQVEPGLERVGLLALFAVVVCAEDAARPKPAPDLYLAAAERLGAAPDACLAFEDTAEGLASARAAGMQAVDVTTPELAATAAALAGR
jgi:HAD superfamily hydrolase (TIGR01509 family)